MSVTGIEVATVTGISKEGEGPGLNPAPVLEACGRLHGSEGASEHILGKIRAPKLSEGAGSRLRLDIWSVVGLPPNRSPASSQLVSLVLQRCLLPLLGNIASGA